MKYLKLFESEEKPLITRDLALDFQDIFLELEDYDNIVTEKSYYDNDSEEWKKIDDFGKLTYNQYSISFYMTKSFPTRALVKNGVDKEFVIEMVNSCKRAIEASNYLIGNTITYRDFVRGEFTYNDKEISVDEIESLIDKDIISISITLWSF